MSVPLKCHDGYGTGLLSDTSLFYVDDIHDDATFQHLSQAGFHRECRLSSVGLLGRACTVLCMLLVVPAVGRHVFCAQVRGTKSMGWGGLGGVALLAAWNKRRTRRTRRTTTRRRASKVTSPFVAVAVF